MLEYIRRLLPRLKQYSESLDARSIFVDQSWILIDEDGNRHTYIFQNNGTLIVSINGQVITSRWNYIQSAKSLYLNTNTQQLLLKSAFVARGLMFLKLDGSLDKPWIFANENEVPDLDIKKYLYNFIIRKMRLIPFPLAGSTIFYNEENGTKVFYDEDFNLLNLKYQNNAGKSTIVQNGVIQRIYYTRIYPCDKGILKVEQEFVNEVSYGDVVYLNGYKAPNGIYKISADVSCTVNEGVITEVKTDNYFPLKVMLIFLSVVAFIFLLFYIIIKNIDPPIVENEVPAQIEILPTYSTQDYKQEIIKWFDYIANKNFDSAAEVYNDIVNDYYGKKNVDKLLIKQKIDRYWGKHNSDVFLKLDTNSFATANFNEGINIGCNAMEWFEDKVTKLPMIYQVGYSFVLNDKLKIIEEDAKINSQVLDSAKLLHLPPNTSLSELRTYPYPNYLSSIFQDLNRGLKSNEYNQELIATVIAILGEEFTVFVSDTFRYEPISIKTFLEGLMYGPYVFESLSDFTINNSGTITAVKVEVKPFSD